MVNTRTLSIDESVHAQHQRVDHLYVVIAGGKPGGGARWALTGIDTVEIGRGATRAVRRDGSTLRVDVPDPWMSSSHLRFERDRAHWLAVDAGSRNGILVNGAKQDRAIVADHDVIEAGRSFFMLRVSEPAAEPALELPARPQAGGLVTLDPMLARSFEELARIAASPVP
ncbi:MAG TPA: FHA domain-containing protein, partial [Kofleriaceae bacterium]|nr:FHA domain-containing protein [Kofleriaceae bacterium]